MEKPYQIANRRAMQRFETTLDNRQQPVQLLLPAPEIVAALREGVGELIRRAGLALITLLMKQEVEELVGPRGRSSGRRRAYRWGREDGSHRIDGQKVPVKRPRVRAVAGSEMALGSYLRFQHDPQFDPKLWREVMRGLSTRNYRRTLHRFAEAHGIEKSAVSEPFVEASRRKLRELIERDLKHLDLCAVRIEGIHLHAEHQPFIEQKLIAAWAMFGYQEAKQALENVRAELERLNPSAARSLAEGLEETLTIHRLGVPEKLRKTLFSLNPIESAFSVVEEKCGRVKK